MKRTNALILILLLTSAAEAQSQWATVRVRSHGGSATVIETREGRSLLLSCSHMFRGRDRTKRMTFDMPWPSSGSPPQRVESRVLAVDHDADLALIELDYGPLPYVCPVAPAGHSATRCLSVGYDNMRLPAQQRETTITAHQGSTTWTREPPWHGRSGGALIDKQSGYLVGVVSGYVDPRRGPGVYASHTAILAFLRGGAGPQCSAPISYRPHNPYARQSAPLTRPAPICPGGT